MFKNKRSGSEKCADVESVKKNRTNRAGTRDTVLRKHENSINELEKRENANPLLKRSENKQSGTEKCADVESVKKTELIELEREIRYCENMRIA